VWGDWGKGGFSCNAENEVAFYALHFLSMCYDILTGVIDVADCKLCNWFRNKVFANDLTSCNEINEYITNNSRSWERYWSTDKEQWDQEPDYDRLLHAYDIREKDEKSSIPIFTELAEKGSIDSMKMLGYVYQAGVHVDTDFETSYGWYQRAINAGSWMATLDLAGVLFANEQYDECEALLKNGIESDYIPSYFWLAWYRVKRLDSQYTYKSVKPLLDRAFNEGYPVAIEQVARWMIRGKFGILKIPTGFIMVLKLARRYHSQHTEQKESLDKGTAEITDQKSVTS
jgi:hypothetical protein